MSPFGSVDDARASAWAVAIAGGSADRAVGMEEIALILDRWRYQPIWTQKDNERVLSLCECYFDNDDNLVAWTDPLSAPQGDSADDLRKDIIWMLAAIIKWEPVLYNDLAPGIKFTRNTADAEDLIAQMTAQDGPHDH